MDPSELTKRRKRLLKAVGRDGVAIVPTAPEKIRNRDAEFPYRPDSDFFYLTGFPEPEAVAVFAPGRQDGEYILFCRERDPAAEIWTGRRAGLEGARARFGADQALPIGKLDEMMPGLLARRRKIFYAVGCYEEYDGRVRDWLNRVRAQVRAGAHTPGEIIALDRLLHENRLIKTATELKTMRHAAQVAAQAHRQAMQACRPGMMEYEVEAEILHTFRRHGGVPAYNAIVGGGANACILHYTENNAVLNDGDLLLIDAGVELDCYASDITRTFPVNGRFSEPQRAIYELVLAAQQAAIGQVRPGNHWNAPHEAAVKVLTKGLVKLGLLKGETRKLIKDNAYREFYMHRTGHWLGMDVHDVGDYKDGDRWRELKPGMVLTVEPGLYIAPDAKVARQWRGIGVRIEDDVAVTRQGCEVLSKDAPKTVEDIEALMAA